MGEIYGPWEYTHAQGDGPTPIHTEAEGFLKKVSGFKKKERVQKVGERMVGA